MDTNEEEQQENWHSLEVDAVFQSLQSTVKGLTEEEALERTAIYGPNLLPESSRESKAIRFLLQFHNPLIYVLIASSVITAFLGHLLDTSIILAVVAINAIIGFIQEGKAEKAIDAIRQMLAPSANVLRDGERKRISARKLVPGDVVLLDAGDKVPADLRLFQSHRLQVQEAVLTGESVAVEKGVFPVENRAVIGDRVSMVYSGTLVIAGKGRGVVVATGLNTEVGKIMGLLSKVEQLTTPLVKKMDIFARWVTLFILLVAGLILLFGYFIGHHDFSEIFMAVVGLSVAAIPEGLPAVLTITLAVGVQEMAKRHAIIRRLPAIETLGSVSVICTDKTGTLTFNEMSVETVALSFGTFSVGGVGYLPSGEILLEGQVVDPEKFPGLNELALAAVLCSDAVLRKDDEGWVVEGDPMEGALLSMAGKIGVLKEEARGLWTCTDTIPFDPNHRYMAALNHDHEGDAFIFVKGAPERILAMCFKERTKDGGTEPVNKSYWEKMIIEIAKSGQRVLALAVKNVNPRQVTLEYSDVEEQMIFLGLVGLIDPPRPDASAAVRECQKAGIRVKMITGDHAVTAKAIGQQIGLINRDRILTGAEIENMDDETLREVALETDIFARTSPEHKLRLVIALQSHGLIVAMTGDGVNDAPALKRADAGIAMGRRGSDAAIEASEVVLADDSFTSIAAAVREGRTVYDNIKKVISWTLPTNAGEAMTIIVALLFGMELPVTPIQILWINLITAITLGIALAFEPTEESTMHLPPRPRNAPLLTGDLFWHMILVSLLFLCSVYGVFFVAIELEYSTELARTLVFNTLVVLEIFHLFFIRNIYGTSLRWELIKGTKVIWSTVLVVTAAQLAATYLPVLHMVLGTVHVPLLEGSLIPLIGILFFAIIEIEKQFRLFISKKGNKCLA